MNATRALLLALAMLAFAPAASAGVDLGAPKIVERGFEPGAASLFEMPILFTAEGHGYVKLLPTAGNAVNDGTRANGTLSPPAGWRVALALARADGTREDLGAFVDSTPSPLVEVAADERLTLLATVHAPAEADAKVEHRVYLAVAQRLGDEASGQASGAAMDQARAITLVLSPAIAAAPATDEEPAAANEGEATGATDVAPVAPIDESSDATSATPTARGTPGWIGGPAMAVALALGLAARLKCRR